MRSTASPHDAVSAVPFKRATSLSVGEDRSAEVGRVALECFDALLRDLVAQRRALCPGNRET
jgi:hypothetical protein